MRFVFSVSVFYFKGMMTMSQIRERLNELKRAIDLTGGNLSIQQLGDMKLGHVLRVIHKHGIDLRTTVGNRLLNEGTESGDQINIVTMHADERTAKLIVDRHQQRMPNNTTRNVFQVRLNEGSRNSSLGSTPDKNEALRTARFWAHKLGIEMIDLTAEKTVNEWVFHSNLIPMLREYSGMTNSGINDVINRLKAMNTSLQAAHVSLYRLMLENLVATHQLTPTAATEEYQNYVNFIAMVQRLAENKEVSFAEAMKLVNDEVAKDLTEDLMQDFDPNAEFEIVQHEVNLSDLIGQPLANMLEQLLVVNR